MAPRYEYSDANPEVVVLAPYDADDWYDFYEDFPVEEAVADGTHALVIGNPYASAYAIFGTLDELARLTGQMGARVEVARRRVPIDGEVVNRPPAIGAA